MAKQKLHHTRLDYFPYPGPMDFLRGKRFDLWHQGCIVEAKQEEAQFSLVTITR